MNSRGRWRVLAVGWIATAILGMWGLAAAPGDTSFLDNLYTLPRRLHARPQRRARLGQLAAADRALARPARGRRLAARGPRGRLAPADRRVPGGPPHRPLGRARARRARHADRRGALRRGPRRRGGRGRPVRRRHPAALRRRGCEVVEGDAREPRTLRRPGCPPRPRCGRLRHRCHERRDRGRARRAGAGAGRRRAARRRAPHDAGLCSLLRHQSLRTAGRGSASTSSTSTPRAPGCCWSAIRSPRPERQPAAPRGRRHRPARPLPRAGGRAQRRRRGIAITLIDRDAAGAAEGLLLAHPGLAGRADWRAVDVDLERPVREGAERLHGGWATRPRSWWPSTTTRARSRPACCSAPARGPAGRGHRPHVGLGRPLAAAGRAARTRACSRSPCSSAPARASHRRGRRPRAGCARHPRRLHRARRGTPYDVPWDELPAEVQESNRRQADALAASLAEIGCDLVPLGGWGAPRPS